MKEYDFQEPGRAPKRSADAVADLHDGPSARLLRDARLRSDKHALLRVPSYANRWPYYISTRLVAANPSVNSIAGWRLTR